MCSVYNNKEHQSCKALIFNGKKEFVLFNDALNIYGYMAIDIW